MIRKHIKKIKEKLVIICTYQSSDKLMEASKGIIYDFGIFDEAHKTVGQTNKFSLALFNKNIAIKQRLFMSAILNRMISLVWTMKIFMEDIFLRLTIVTIFIS